MTGVIAMMAGSGSSRLDTQTVTTGGNGTAGAQDRVRGYSTAAGVGSIVDGTSNIYSGASIVELHWYENTGSPYYDLTITGATDSGWTMMSVNGVGFARASASFGGGTWVWVTSDTVGTQAFGSIGASVAVIFS